MRRGALTGGFLVVLAVGGGWAWHATLAARRAVAPRVAVTTVTRGEFEVTLPMEGVLQSDDALTVSTGKAPGELTMIVADGTVVKAGDVFCRIEARELLRKQTDAELAYKQAKEEIAQRAGERGGALRHRQARHGPDGEGLRRVGRVGQGADEADGGPADLRPGRGGAPAIGV